MTARKAVAAVIILVAAIFGFLKSDRVRAPYVFINESSDHRFDESVRISILAAEKRTGVQNAVVISGRSDENGEIEKIAAQTFKDLKLGQANAGRAILYYFNPAEEVLKIEVGYALEGVLPDITVKGLEMAAKSFVYTDRYQDFWAELINTLNIEIQQKEKGEEPISQGFDFSHFRFLSGGAGISSRSYDASWKQMNHERYKVESKAGPRGGESAEATLNAYLQSLREGRYDSELDILNRESRFFRNITPQTSYQLYRNSRMYDVAGLDRLIEDGSLAWAFFKKNHPVLPIVLRNEGGRWKVHEPLSWSLFQRFEDSNQVSLKYPIQSDSKDLNRYFRSMGRPIFHLATPVSTEFLKTAVVDPLDFRRSLLQLYWLDRAELEIHKIKLESLSNDDLFLAADIDTNLGHFGSFLKTYRLIAQRYPGDSIVQRNWQFYREVLVLNDDDWTLNR